MLTISQRTRNIILYAGIAMMAGGAVMFFLLQPHFAHFQNYQKVTFGLPLIYGVMMVHIDTYRDLGSELTTTNARSRGKAIGLLFCVPLLSIYCLLSWVRDVAG